MRPDFCAFILTHGRPDRLYTLNSLRKSGYTGKLYIVIDDEDKTASQYRDAYQDKVLMFSKSAFAKTFDEGDNFNDRRAIVYARNACFDLAKQVGCKYFIQLDDDYQHFAYRFDHTYQYVYKSVKNLDRIFEAMIEFLESTPIHTVSLTQGGDFIGGQHCTYAKSIRLLRKSMNSFICDVDKPFQFSGRINEDVNTYTAAQRNGKLILTSINQASLKQVTTQSNQGGMTDIYVNQGTYVKSFYTIMFAPSCTRIALMGDKHKRLHHAINWDAAAPKIMREHA